MLLVFNGNGYLGTVYKPWYEVYRGTVAVQRSGLGALIVNGASFSVGYKAADLGQGQEAIFVFHRKRDGSLWAEVGFGIGPERTEDLALKLAKAWRPEEC